MLFEAIRENVTAREAASFYGLRFRGNRAFCPWHDDGKHPALAFYGNGTCYCHSCHKGGDSIALTAQLFGLSMKEAAQKLNDDFRLGLDAGKPLSTAARKQIARRREKQQNEKSKARREWAFLCKVRDQANNELDLIVSRVKPEQRESLWDNPQFVKALSYRSRAETDLDRILDERSVKRNE